MQKNYRNSYKYLPFPCCQVGKCCCWGLHNPHKCPVKKRRGKNVIFSKEPLPHAKNGTELLFPVHISKTSQYVYEIFNYYSFPCSEMSQIYHLNEISHVSQADACTCLKLGSVCTLWVSLPLGILLGWKSLGIQAALGTQAVRFTESASYVDTVAPWDSLSPQTSCYSQPHLLSSVTYQWSNWGASTSNKVYETVCVRILHSICRSWMPASCPGYRTPVGTKHCQPS